MPSYPTSVFAPSAKSAGQTIQHTHVNDLQDEVVAIESGLRTGTAPLNSSGSTMTSLSVTGGSTFASRPVTPPPDAVRLGLDAVLEFAGTSTTAVSWTRQDIAINSSMHSTTTNPTRVTPQSTGLYQCNAMVRFRATAGSGQEISIEDSSGAIIANAVVSTATGVRGLAVSGLKRFDSVTGSTQWVRLVVYSNVSSNGLSTIAGLTQFEVVKL